jgi:ABC-type transport system involved in cytochrome bd biosynthesis fused ATPase/permease subunit
MGTNIAHSNDKIVSFILTAASLRLYFLVFDRRFFIYWVQSKTLFKGARENNLKNVNVRIPKRKITIFIGVSGSGKSSMVFDTVSAEAA